MLTFQDKEKMTFKKDNISILVKYPIITASTKTCL